MDSYFSNFNTLSYSNSTALDITERIVVINNVQKNPYIYYPLDITDGVRADQVAYENYGNPYQSWVLYLTNNIVDPYYEWYMTDLQFQEFVQQKYVSTQRAMQKVKNFRLTNRLNPITVGAYEALSSGEKQYWTPNYNDGPYIVNYVLKKRDLQQQTNFILNFIINGEESTFIKDEVIKIHYDPENGPDQVGVAQVITQNNTNLICQHTFDQVYPISNTFFSNTTTTANLIFTPGSNQATVVYQGDANTDANTFNNLLTDYCFVQVGNDSVGVQNLQISARFLTSNTTNTIFSIFFYQPYTLTETYVSNTLSWFPAINGLSYIYGTESQANCRFVGCLYLANNIPSDELKYWEPLYYYDYERERNEGNRTIKVMQSRYIQDFIYNTQQLLSEVRI